MKATRTIGSISKVRAAWRVRASPWKTVLQDLPPGLEPAWRTSAPHEFEGIHTDAFFFVCAAEGLMQFFDAVTTSGKPCALPSEAADSVWHAWLRWDPIGLERFCRKHFGVPVPHVERAGLGMGALRNTLEACMERHANGLPRAGLPRVFALDASMRMPGGHGYWMTRNAIMYARIGRDGRYRGAGRPHPELSPVAAYLFMQPAHESRHASSCGAVFDGGDGGGDSGCDGGSGSSDGGSSCGSSCGGSCGGGCGGD